VTKHKNTTAQEHSNFLMLAYCGLVLRGFDRERDIPDPILRKVWRLGKRIKELRIPRKRPSRENEKHG
jgi:hypothetical protein